jgi:uncharacterized membrane protein (UPF0182 family)
LRTPYQLNRDPPARRRSLVWPLALLVIVMLAGSSIVSYYVDALWFESLGYQSVFWTRLNLQATIFLAFALLSFSAIYGSYRALRPSGLNELIERSLSVARQRLPVPSRRLFDRVAFASAAFIAVLIGGGMAGHWNTFALYTNAPASAGSLDPVFARSLDFYLFTLPAWRLIVDWLLWLAIIACAVAGLLIVYTAAPRLRGNGSAGPEPTRLWRGLSLAFALLLLAIAARVYLGRFELLLEDGTIFSGISYTDAHVTLPGMWLICAAFILGAVAALYGALGLPRGRILLASAVPALACYLGVTVVGWFVSNFIVKPNQLDRERPFIVHNIEMTRQAFALDRIAAQSFPATSGVEALDAAHNQTTLDNIRLWDVHALQDTLRQIQEIRTYYDFPDIDIDRYQFGGSVHQMMLATRELNIDRLPQSSRNWINEKLIYTHGYGVTMNPVNGFTPEGLPALVLSNMPIQSTVSDLSVTRPEIYFGELTNTDVYVNTHQKEFNYPQGDTNNLSTYQGDAGIRLGGLLRRALIAFDRGDIWKLPFSDDITADSRLLMRRNLLARVQELAPFLTLDPDPYTVVGADGKLYWFMDAFTTSDSYPYSRRYRLDQQPINYIRNSVKIVIDAYTGATTFYVFDTTDPIIAAYRSVFPALFSDAAALSPALRAHVRYPELLLSVQAAVYSLYHMTNPDVFYNREDLWSAASSAPNFVLMTLPGESGPEFIEILPFTPANRNNLIAWIAGRSDGEHYGQAIAFDFPKTKLVDGPLQIEARIDQDAQLSGQLSLWNQQGSRVLRGSLIVIPIGQSLLYAEPIYLQAERSPMPELRLVVLALQDRLAYGPTLGAATAALFGGAPSTLNAASGSSPATAPPSAEPITSAGAAAERARAAPGRTGAADLNDLIGEATRELSDYQQLTAAGKLGEAGQRLEALKRTLDEMQQRRR